MQKLQNRHQHYRCQDSGGTVVGGGEDYSPLHFRLNTASKHISKLHRG